MSESRARRSRDRTNATAEISAIAASAVLVIALALGAWSAFEMVSTLTEHATEGTYYSNLLGRIDALSRKAADADTEYRAYIENPDPRRLKGFNEAGAAMQTEYQELIKLTAEDKVTQAEVQGAKAQTDKTLDSIRDAIDYKRIDQGQHAAVVLGQAGSITGTLRQAMDPLQKRAEAALSELRNRPRDAASSMANWVLVSWVIAALAGVAIAVVAIRQSRAVGQLHRRLKRESIYDALTGLPNNVFLEEWLTRSIARASRTTTKVGVLYIDINNFKQVNHGLGYSEGNKVLLEVSQKLRTLTRSSDFVARVRNDSFALVMPDVTDVHQVETVIARLSGLGVVRAGIAIKTTVGAALFPEDAESADNLLRLSRAAMYRNRQSRRAA